MQVLITSANFKTQKSKCFHFPTKHKILIRPQCCNLIKIFVTASLNSAGLRPGPLTGLQNFFPLDLSYYQIKELLQLDFLPIGLEFSEYSFSFFFPFITYFWVNNNAHSWYYCLNFTKIKQREKLCLLRGLECYFSLDITALWEESSGRLPL